jgi:O-antigen/teichoic acid export membrane protein
MKTLTFYSGLFIFFVLLQRGSGVLTKIVLANTITPYEYGLITLLALTLPGVFQLVTTLNFPQILAHSEEGRHYFGFSMVMSMLIGLVLSALLFIFREPFFSYLNIPLDRMNLFYAVIIFSLFSLTILADFEALYTGLRQYAFPGITMALPSVARLVIIAGLLLAGMQSFEIILIGFVLANVIPLAILALSGTYRRQYLPILSIRRPSRQIFAFGIALFIFGSLNTFGQALIKMVISHDLGIVWQGYFDVSLTLGSFFFFAMGTMTLLSVPEATSADPERIYRRGGLADVTRALFALMVLIFITLSLYSEYLVRVLFSRAYLDASTYFPIMAVGYLFIFVQVFIANLNLSRATDAKDYAIIAVIPLAMLPLFFVLTVYLIDLSRSLGFGNGFLGAYISNTLLFIISTLLTIALVKDLTPLKVILHRIGRLAGCFIVTVLLLMVLRPHPLLGIGIAIILFPALAYATGYVSKDIVRDLVGITRRHPDR